MTGQSMNNATSVKYTMKKNVLDSLKALDVEDGLYLLVREQLLQTEDQSGYVSTISIRTVPSLYPRRRYCTTNAAQCNL